LSCSGGYWLWQQPDHIGWIWHDKLTVVIAKPDVSGINNVKLNIFRLAFMAFFEMTVAAKPEKAMHWTLQCLHCEKRFNHSIINLRCDAAPYDPPAKPAFPEGGESVRCPHCREIAIYERYQLTYSASEKRIPFRVNLGLTI
jgi:hypothetical protein